VKDVTEAKSMIQYKTIDLQYSNYEVRMHS